MITFFIEIRLMKVKVFSLLFYRKDDYKWNLILNKEEKV